MKYLREVMLQYKKASLLPEIGWDFAATAEEPADGEQADAGFCLPQIAAASLSTPRRSKSDTRLLPLLLCQLTSAYLQPLQAYHALLASHYQRGTFDEEQLQFIAEDEQRVFLLYSPDLRRCCAFRCADAGQCYVWTSAIQQTVERANANAVSEANLVLRRVLDQATVKCMGWLNERQEDGQLRCTFLVLTNKELLFYDFVPWTAHAWAFPAHSYPLIHSRLVQAPQSIGSIEMCGRAALNRLDQSGNCSANNENNFNLANSNGHGGRNGSLAGSLTGASGGLTVRFGTTLGVVVVSLLGESQKQLIHWANQIVQNANNAALAMGEAVFGASAFIQISFGKN